MSWNVNYIGMSGDVSQALKANSEVLSGQSKVEYDAALPHMCALVEQNHSSTYPQILQVSANSHGSGDGSFNSVNVSIVPLTGRLV